MLSQFQSEAEGKLVSLEEQLKVSQDKVVNQESLLSTVAHDKENLSRVVAQNKELKNNLAELQDAFVVRTNQNAELANSLETEIRIREKLEGKCTDLTERLTTENRKVLELMEQVNILGNQNDDQVINHSFKNTLSVNTQQDEDHSTKSVEENIAPNQLEESHTCAIQYSQTQVRPQCLCTLT